MNMTDLSRAQHLGKQYAKMIIAIKHVEKIRRENRDLTMVEVHLDLPGENHNIRLPIEAVYVVLLRERDDLASQLKRFGIVTEFDHGDPRR